MSGRLTQGFRDVMELTWTEFVATEDDLSLSNLDAIIASLVRACKKGNLRAIQVALDRLDGKIATEIEVTYPQFYTLFPQATMAVDSPTIIDIKINEDVKRLQNGGSLREPVIAKPTEELPTGSLRAVLERMIDAPKKTSMAISQSADFIDSGKEAQMNPRVKSVIVAGLMKLVYEGRVNAVFEVFDQLDGKVAESYKLLGDDVFLYNYATIAPAGAYLNDDGVYQLEADNTTNSWVARLEEKNNAKKLR